MRSQPPSPDSVSVDPRFTIKVSEQIRLADTRMGNRRGGAPVRRTVTVAVGDFGLESLGGALTRNSADLSRSFVQAVRYYLADQGSGRAGWPYPDFRREEELNQTVEVRVEIDDPVWEAFSEEAERQRVSTDQLAQHAVLYFAADRDAGRLAQRIVEDLDS